MQRGVKREHLVFHQCIGPANKKRPVMSLPVTAPVMRVDVEVEDAVFEEVDAIDVELMTTGREAYEVLEWATKSACLVYDVPFLRLLEAVEQSNEDIFQGVQAGIYDPPYSTPRNAELSNSENDWLIVQDMSHFVDLTRFRQ